MNKPAWIANYCAASLLGMIFIPVFVFTALLMLKVNSDIKWQLPLILGAVTPFILLVFLEDMRCRIMGLLLLAVIICISYYLSGIFYDNTWDSRAYHADGILLLLKGVNPFYEKMQGFDDLWTNHYPKMTWYFASLIIHLTDNYNIGKILNFLLVFSVFSYVFAFFRIRNFSLGDSIAASLVAALNPVTISQIHSFYVDGALASLFTLLVFAVLACVNKPASLDKIVLFFVSCLLITIKFTGLVYLLVMYGFGGTVLLIACLLNVTKHNKTRLRDFILLTCAALLVGLCFMGYNPYISNYREAGNPFYPLAGAGKIDVVSAQSPKVFLEQNMSNPEKLVRSVFSETLNIADKGGTENPKWKIPFTFSQKELSLYFSNDIRIAGWGVLFGGIVLLSLILYLISGAWRDIHLSLLIIFILISACINPGSWWARYAPQVALIPFVMMIAVLASQQHWQKWSARGLMLLMLLNAALIFPASTWYFYTTTAKIQSQIDTMLTKCGKGIYQISDVEGYHYEQFLHKNGIEVEYAKSPDEDIKKLYPKKLLFPLDGVFLYKEGCNH